MHTFTFLLAVICLIHLFHGASPSCSCAFHGNCGTKSTSSVISRPFTRRKIAKTPLRDIKAPLSTEELDRILVRWELLSGILDKGQDFLYVAFQSVPIKWYSPGNHPFCNFMKTCQNKQTLHSQVLSDLQNESLSRKDISNVRETWEWSIYSSIYNCS